MRDDDVASDSIHDPVLLDLMSAASWYQERFETQPIVGLSKLFLIAREMSSRLCALENVESQTSVAPSVAVIWAVSARFSEAASQSPSATARKSASSLLNQIHAEFAIFDSVEK